MPTSVLGKVIAGMWLLAGIGLLVFAYTQRSINDMPEAFIWLIIAISFPIGFVGAVLVGSTWPAISVSLDLGYKPFIDVLPYWFVLMTLGYIQWFILLPLCVRRLLKRNA